MAATILMVLSGKTGDWAFESPRGGSDSAISCGRLRSIGTLLILAEGTGLVFNIVFIVTFHVCFGEAGDS